MTATEPDGLPARLKGWLGRLAIRLAPGDFEIRYRPGVPAQVRGQVPAVKVGTIQEFLARDLQPAGRLVIRGSWGPHRALHLRFAGTLAPGARQQTRNFLFELLR